MAGMDADDGHGGDDDEDGLVEIADTWVVYSEQCC